MIKFIVKGISINRIIHICVSFLEGTRNETPRAFTTDGFFLIHNSNKFIKSVCHTTDLDNRINDSEEIITFTWVIVTCSYGIKFIINFSTITEHAKSSISWYSGTGMSTYFNVEIVWTDPQARHCLPVPFIGDIQNVGLNSVARFNFPVYSNCLISRCVAPINWLISKP